MGAVDNDSFKNTLELKSQGVRQAITNNTSSCLADLNWWLSPMLSHQSVDKTFLAGQGILPFISLHAKGTTQLLVKQAKSSMHLTADSHNQHEHVINRFKRVFLQ